MHFLRRIFSPRMCLRSCVPGLHFASPNRKLPNVSLEGSSNHFHYLSLHWVSLTIAFFAACFRFLLLRMNTQLFSLRRVTTIATKTIVTPKKKRWSFKNCVYLFCFFSYPKSNKEVLLFYPLFNFPFSNKVVGLTLRPLKNSIVCDALYRVSIRSNNTSIMLQLYFKYHHNVLTTIIGC